MECPYTAEEINDGLDEKNMILDGDVYKYHHADCDEQCALAKRYSLYK